MSKTTLCTQSEMVGKESREFKLLVDGSQYSIFLVNHEKNFYAYRNACPHTGSPLNWQADIFLDVWKQKIQCSLHGAQFEIQSGRCIDGPCLGEHLQPINIALENQNIVALM